MTENDYIAEYVKERRPEILTSFDYIIFRITKTIAEVVNIFTSGFSEVWSNLTPEQKAVISNITDQEDEDETRDREESEE